MTNKFLIAAVSASFLFGASAMAADAPKPPKLTAAVQKALSETQKATGAKDYPAALAALEKAKAVSGPTPYDTLMINRFAMTIHLGMNDMAAAGVDAEAAADVDPAAIPDVDKGAVYKAALQLAVNAKHADKAMKYAKLFLATTPPPTAQDVGLATMAIYQGGDYAGATAIAQKNIESATAAGQKPALSDLQIIMNAQVKQNEQAGAEKTLESLVANYGQQQDWNQLMAVGLTTKGMRDIDYIYMGRLMLLQGGTISGTDASLVGSAANSNKLGLYGDAGAMQKFGGPAPDPRAVADKASLPKQIADGAKSDGEYNIKTAEAVYGYGDYAQAETLARAAKTKPGVKDPTEPDMVIAMSLAAQGKYAEAAPLFDGIKQSNPASARVVRLWTYFVKSKASPATAAAK
ncbi:MAG: hypothetical protein ABI608_01980 [Rhizomicrobium sp.]